MSEKTGLLMHRVRRLQTLANYQLPSTNYHLPTMDAIDRIGSAFLRRILLRMKELGMSQTELARQMNVSRPYITKVLHQDVNFSFRTAAKLANALKMDFFPELRPQEIV